MRQRAFSLVELLLVVVILMIVLSFTLPAINSVVRGGSITRAGQMVGDQIALARQAAVARNQTVELRLFKLPGEGVDDQARYRAIQTVVQKEDGSFQPLSRVLKFEPHTEVSDSAQLSTLVASPTVKGSADVAGQTVPYVGFRFRPDGSTDLSFTASDGWFLTVKDTRPSDDAIPKNFYTIRVDPHTGRTRVFRP